MKRLILSSLLLCLLTTFVNAQLSNIKDGNDAFYFDAIVFKGDSADFARIDCYLLVPYQSLTFVKYDESYLAKFSANLVVFDSLGNIISSAKFDKNFVENDFSVTQGATAKFDVTQKVFFIPPGSYKVKATLLDENSKNEYSQSRAINVIDFNKYENVLSGLLLVSSIEENQGRWRITPHISDNIGNLKDGFFVFFEFYANETKKVDFIYQIFEKDELIEQGKRIAKDIKIGTNRIFLRVQKPAKFTRNNYILRVLALKPDASDDYELEDILAVAQRTIKATTRISGFVLNDLNKAIRQLRYVANQKELEFIQTAQTDDEKMRRFEEFWKLLDPTPNTERNEAFEEYYMRIAYANEHFRSYTEGWLTDKGMVYIIFGRPISIEKSNPMSDGRVYERWIYPNNREFLFLDNTGFGDYKLIRPLTVTEKYRYNS
jgi:GWxTD domain-containing protein